MATDRVVVIGAGIAGLVAAVELAGQGLEVTVCERAAAPGGKMREVRVGPKAVDAGPTVFTMRWVFEEIFAAAGTTLAEHVTLRPTETLARHAWSERERLDLFADLERSADAIGAFAGPAEARGYRGFCERAQRIYETLRETFIRAPRPTPLSLVRGAGLGRVMGISPFVTLWGALGEHFADPRLRQLFGRYATYCGSSPFAAPATLMLVAHVEREGVWLVEGGMHRLAAALARLAESRGARLRYDTEVAEIAASAGRATGVRLATGEFIPAGAVVCNADIAAVSSGRFGRDAVRAVPGVRPASRSLSAVTWAMLAETEGFPLLRHTVFFSGDYRAEFDDILERRRLPGEPTVYVCAQDRDGETGAAPGDPEPSGAERLLCLVNAPATGDINPPSQAEIERCSTRAFGLMERCGLRVRPVPEATQVAAPAEFERLFPATGGALYGQAAHGWAASFQRPGSRSSLPGLYLAGGSVHPGPGVPMAALSGRQAAASLIADLASSSPSRRTAIPGGISTR